MHGTAAAAEVSVNTVYNYFEAKEDLILPPDQASARRLADIVRDRAVGESAAQAVVGRLRDEARRRDRRLGLTEGFGRVYRMMRAAPTLTARLEELGHQMTEELAAVLAEETAAEPDDLRPRVVAAQLGACQALVFAEIGERTGAGEPPDTIAAAILKILDTVEEMLGDPVRDYAIKKA
ncbi:TetR/AcrR family transcriptional regulator [Actinomadura sp. DC4]|uniref:TetR/AcrR family transcriptional regulator n=1 Tax=Actinomadura sp. DC4 TaxID=3055069 RepID=UPI0025B179F4|nr:TetR/AcrR family transcriptional regulator [Actinomadura sp. DC4]MDN3358038.1 TetR/AcrR family transcriptional regulator [Actinomadura sp. DC4]